MITKQDFIDSMPSKNPKNIDVLRWIFMCVNTFNFNILDIDWTDIQSLNTSTKK